jgi:uncharacterized protein
MGTHKRKIAVFITLIIRVLKSLLQLPDGCCRFTPTCSEYVKEAIETFPFHIAIVKSIRRFLSCHPLHKGGYNPVKKNTPERVI